jgi:ribose 5-phosphate isomerase B
VIKFINHGESDFLMADISDSDLHQIVSRVVQQLLGGSPAVPKAPPQAAPASTPAAPAITAERKAVAIGADHGGFELKEALKTDLTSLGYEVIDVGAKSKDPVDYPDFAHAVALLVSQGQAWRGIMIDGAGIGSCMVANKVPGVRAALAYDLSSAMNSREHNNANLLTLGAGLIGVNLAKQIIKTWLSTEFGGGRHQPRVDKIAAIEKQYLK